MNLVTPELGLIVWQVVVFIVLLFLLSRFAWKPILSSLKERESSIEQALESAKFARIEMDKLTAQNEQLLQTARIEKEEILKKAQQTAKDLIDEARTNASKEANRLIEDARKAIETEKKAALSEMKKQVAALSLEIAEKVLRKELFDPGAQQQLVESLIDETKLN